MGRAPIARVKQAGSSWCSGKTIRAHEQFVCDPAAAHKGFRSWDDFHTRRCWPGVRPIASPGDDAVVANPCGPVPYRIAREVSTCDIQVAKGQHVSKVDEIGMFHFSGSTACLLFRPGVALEFDTGGQEPGPKASSIHVGARIATVG